MLLFKPFKILFRKVPGRALYLAIVISFISGVLALLFILSQYYSSVEYTNLEKQMQLRDQVSSALITAVQPQSIIPFDSPTQHLEDNDGLPECTVIKHRWGVYSIAKASAQWKYFREQRIALYGNHLISNDPVGLYVADHGHYLAVSGDTYLSGKCFLPALGARKAYIDGNSFKYTNVVQGTITKSSETLPELPHELIEYLSTELPGASSASDSVVEASYLRKNKYLQSFNFKTIRITDTKEILLDRIEVEGNYLIQSDVKIWIDNTAKLENIICIAPVIEVEKGFEGSVQLICSDSLVIAEDVDLQYPSSVVCVGKNQSSAYCLIGEQTKVAGTVIVCADINQGSDAILYLHNEAQISGLVYCTGKVEHRGKVYGSMYCNKLVLQTPRGYYENHLLDAWVDPTGLEPNFVVGSVNLHSEVEQKGGIIQWLN